MLSHHQVREILMRLAKTNSKPNQNLAGVPWCWAGAVQGRGAGGDAGAKWCSGDQVDGDLCCLDYALVMVKLVMGNDGWWWGGWR